MKLKLKQYLNAPFSIRVTLDGILRYSILLFKNEFDDIILIDVGMMTVKMSRIDEIRLSYLALAFVFDLPMILALYTNL